MTTHKAAKSYQMISSITEIMDLYDGFILDQFGVLHNGQHSLEGAAECIQFLHAKGKKLIILSNSSSPSAACLARLPQLGLDHSHFVAAITSGEETSHYLSRQYPGKKCIFFTWYSKPPTAQIDFLKQCGNLQVTQNVQEADLVLLQGVQIMMGEEQETSIPLGDFMETGDTSSVLDPILDECAARHLPMVCANPDFIMVRPDGSIAHMPGKIARRYRELGGTCTSFGKPEAAVFKAVLSTLQLSQDRVVHVGDSLHHDIAGANAVGVASVLVTGGIHRDEVSLGSERGAVLDRTTLDHLLAKHNAMPTHIISMFRL